MKKKIGKKKISTEPGWATAQVSLRLGWALGRTGRAAGAGMARRVRRRALAGAGRACLGGLRAAGARRARGLGVPVRAGWACWLVSWAKLVHSAPGSVLTQFFGPGSTRYFSRATK